MKELASYGHELEAAGLKAHQLASVATRKTGFDIIRDYKQTARWDTGTMRESAGSPDITNGGLTMTVGPTVEYAVYQEEGTSTVTGDHALRNATDRRVPGWEQALAQIPEMIT